MWTRNYNNLLNTAMTKVSKGVDGVSPYPFDDTYTGNYKNALGKIYEICNYNTHRTTSYSNMNSIARPAFVKQSSGTEFTSSVSLLSDIQSANGISYASEGNRIWVAFGSSDDEETYDDYMLENLITSFISNSLTGKATQNADGTMTVDYKILLTATADFTIKEIGIFSCVPFYAPDSSSGAYAYFALINRIVLDEPITAVTDEVVHVNFSITTPKISISG